MADAAGEETKAPRTAAIDGDGASTRAASVPPVEQEQQRPAPAPLPAAGVAGGGSAAVQRQSCGEEEEDDDEQVERFYALLANIRALRGLCTAGESGSPAAGRGRKWPREAEAPWRPAFRMEDFEFAEKVSHGTADAQCAVKKQGAGVVARRPAMATARAAADDREEDEAAEQARGRKLCRRVAAQGLVTCVDRI